MRSRTPPTSAERPYLSAAVGGEGEQTLFNLIQFNP